MRNMGNWGNKTYDESGATSLILLPLRPSSAVEEGALLFLLLVCFG